MSGKIYTTAIILAAGLGTRMRSEITKQQMKICGRSVLYRSAFAFEHAELVDSIIVVCREEELEFAKAELSGLAKINSFVVGGKTRSESAEHGFLAASGADFVAIHDAARCMITPSEIDRVISVAHTCGAASATSPITDTVKMVDGSGTVIKTVSRDGLRAAGTPQVFSAENYRMAISASRGAAVTDDNMMAELAGIPVKCVDVDCHNFKITTRDDIEYAEFLIERGYAE